MNWFRNIPKWVLAVMLFAVSGSFIFWGIPSVFEFGGLAPVIHVGDTKIFAQDFQTQYNRYLRERSEQEQHTITTEEGRARNLDVAARERLVTRLLLEKKARELGLSISRSQVIDELRKIPGMADAKGNINPQRLGQVLQNAQMSEGALIEDVQNQMLQHQLIGTVIANVQLPPEMVQALHRYRLERRVAEYLLIDPSRAGQIADPSDADLKRYYEANIGQFTAPEYRSVSIVTASAKEVAAKLDVPEADIQKAYDASKAKYQTPEKRKLEQIRFPTEAKAREARAQLDAGKTFEEVAKAAGYKAEDTQLGDVPAGDPTVPPEAFTMELNKPSAPLKGTFGWVIIRATASTPGTVKALEAVRQELRDAIATERAKDQVFKLSTDYDDARGGGQTMEEASTKLSLKLTKLTIDKSSKDEAGQTVDVPVGGDFVSRVFATESGGDGSGLQENSDGVYYEYRVDNIKSSAKKPFESVRNEVLTMWRTEQQRKKLQAVADDLVKRGNGGATMAQLASSLGVAALKSDPLPRMSVTPTAVFSPDALQKLFDTKIGGFFSGPVADGKSIVVARVDSTAQQAEGPGSPESGIYAQILNQAFVGDIANEFTTALRHQTCNRTTVWESILGGHLPDCVNEEQFKRARAGDQ